MLGLVLVIILVLLLIGALPHWPYTQSYGYGYWPSGVFFIILLVLVVLMLTGRLGTLTL
jgi:Na+/melibiose symporter-like transporter